MKKQKLFFLGIVLWILGGMVFNGYHHHRESTEANLAKPCCICKIQNQNTAAPAKEIALKADLSLRQEKVVLFYLTPQHFSIHWGASPRDPPVVS